MTAIRSCKITLDYFAPFLQGILEQHGRKTLSKLIYCLFTPALTFTKLAPVLSGPHLLLWLPLVINMFVRCVPVLA